MERKRNRTEIMHDMLRIIQEKKGKIKRTHLMYKANLSHNQMKLYLEELSNKELILIGSEENKSSLNITIKGQDFFMQYLKIREFERTFGL
jgi:predicted transcriptional regulator